MFRSPTEEEERVVAELLASPQYQQLVKKKNPINGLPVADPFIIASGKVNGAAVVTMESVDSGWRTNTGSMQRVRSGRTRAKGNTHAIGRVCYVTSGWMKSVTACRGTS